MNDKDLEVAGKAFEWVQENSFPGSATSNQDADEINLILFKAFIAGYQNAENDSESPA